MPASEIDDIFASAHPFASTSSQPPSSEKPNKKKKRKSAKLQVSSQKVSPEVREQSGSPRRIPETILDPSARPAAVSVKGKQLSQPSTAPVQKSKKRKLEKDDEQRFKDSRGSGPSMSLVPFLHLYLHELYHFRTEDGGRFCYLQGGRTWHHGDRRRSVVSMTSRCKVYQKLIQMSRYTSMSVRLPMLCVQHVPVASHFI